MNHIIKSGTNEWAKDHSMVILLDNKEFVLNDISNSFCIRYTEFKPWPNATQLNIVSTLLSVFNRADFIVLNFHSGTMHRQWITNQHSYTEPNDNLLMEMYQSRMLSDRHGIIYYQYLVNVSKADAGKIIVFKNENDMLLAKTTKLFGLMI